MKSHFYHLQINIDFGQNQIFYYELMNLLGWTVIFEEKDMFGFKSGRAGDLWFVDAEKKIATDYDNKGVNHIAIRVSEQADIDEVKGFLQQYKIKALFGTPKHREDFTNDPKETYYQIMFESPDKILFEIVYIGKRL